VYSSSWEVSSQSYRASLAMWDHTVLPATRHKWMCPALTPASQAGTRFTYPGGMEGWVHLDSLIEARPGIEPTPAWSQVRRPNRYSTNSMHHELFNMSFYVYTYKILHHIHTHTLADLFFFVLLLHLSGITSGEVSSDVHRVAAPAASKHWRMRLQTLLTNSVVIFSAFNRSNVTNVIAS